MEMNGPAPDGAPPNPRPGRLTAARKLIAGVGLDALLVASPENRRYFSGFTARDDALTEASGFLLISAGAARLLTDFRYREWAAAEAPDFEVTIYTAGLAKLLPELLESLSCRRLGFEAAYLSVSLYNRLVGAVQEAGREVEWLPQEALLEPLREVKEAGEVAAIRRSLALSEQVIGEAGEFLAPGRSEGEVAWFIERRLRELGAEAPAFPPIVAAGRNAARPHHHPDSTLLAPGDPVIIDMGARLAGYCSDISRTFCVGEPDARFKEIYSLVRQAQARAETGIKAGMTTDAADALAREVIAAAGYGEAFGHSLGHGVGLAVHERPSLSPYKERATILPAGAVATVEPGIYLPDWGGVRLEDMILVTADGADILNTDRNFYRFA